MEEEQSISFFDLRLINQVIIQTPCAPPVIYVQDNMAIHDLDQAVVNVSIVLTQYLTVYRLIGKIRVFMNENGYIPLQMKGKTW